MTEAETATARKPETITPADFYNHLFCVYSIMLSALMLATMKNEWWHVVAELFLLGIIVFYFVKARKRASR